MKLIVTGGLGFIGSNFVRHMLSSRRDVEIVNIDKRTYAGNPANLADFGDNPRYRWLKADICDSKAMLAAFEGVDAAVHFAAETHVDRSILGPAAFVKTNVLGTQTLLEAARARGIKKFVHVSTDEVYGSVQTGESVEGDPLLPNSPYAASKAASDLMARSYFVTFGMPVVVTRCSNNFGPYQYPEKALPLLITNALEDKPFPLYGDGMNVRDWLFVLDHVTAIETVLERGVPGEIYNIGGGYSAPNIEFIRSVLRVMGKPESLIQFVKDRPGHDRRYALSHEKLTRELGWKPSFAFEDAIKLTVQWYTDNRGWWTALKKKAAYNSYHKKQYRGK